MTSSLTLAELPLAVQPPSSPIAAGSDWIINVTDLGKKYRIYHQQRERYTSLRDELMRRVRTVFRERRPADLHWEDFWALKDVSFEVKQGEVVGIIGRNGAGKSTLLKILSRITEPTEGRVRLRGRVASLLEVGTGFHPELTGRENIYLNGAILGMSRAEIRRKFPEIVAFAEIEQFLDTPVKRYSSGMYVRLAFAVAAHLEPEVLIVDEVLAVGDAAFQQKCLGKMSEVAKGGRTVLFVSHNMAAIQGFCETAIYLERGRVRAIGAVDSMIGDYLKSFVTAATDCWAPLPLGKDLELRRLNFTPNPTVPGKPVTFVAELASHAPQQIAEFTLLLFSALGARLAVLDLRRFGVQDLPLVETERLVIEGIIHNLPLVEGEYRVGIYLATKNYHGDFLDLTQITVGSRQPTGGAIPYAPAHRGLVELDFEVTALEHLARRPYHDDATTS